MGLQWALTFCNQTKFVMKTYDDMYVNIPGLMKKVADNRDILQPLLAVIVTILVTQ